MQVTHDLSLYICDPCNFDSSIANLQNALKLEYVFTYLTTVNLLTLIFLKTNFFNLNGNLSLSSLNSANFARNLSFIFDEYLNKFLLCLNLAIFIFAYFVVSS